MNGVELAQSFYSPPGSKGCTKARRAEPLGPSLSSGVIFHPSGSGPWGRSCRLLIPTPVPSLPPTSRGGRMCGLERGASLFRWNVECVSFLLSAHPQRYSQPRWTFLDPALGFHQPISAAQHSFLPPPPSPSLPPSPQPKPLLWMLIYRL